MSTGHSHNLVKRRLALVPAAVTAIATTLGCSRGLDNDRGFISAVVYGTVTRASGSPAVGAKVASVSFLSGCAGQIVAGSEWSATDAQGSFRVRLRDFASPRSMCVAVLVAPGAAGVTDTVKVTGPTVSFRDTYRAPEDSARIDVRLPN